MIYDDERTAEQIPYRYVNNNGSSAEALIEQLITARTAVRKAVDALRQAYPNGRDYQTAPFSAYEKAREIWDARLSAMGDLERALYAEAIFIQGQQR